MVSVRNLNFDVIDQLLDAGVDLRDLLDSLVKADDADNINMSLAYIVRISDYDELLDKTTSKQLNKYGDAYIYKHSHRE